MYVATSRMVINLTMTIEKNISVYLTTPKFVNSQFMLLLVFTNITISITLHNLTRGDPENDLWLVTSQ